MLIERAWAMPNKNTFDIPPIRALIAEELGEDTTFSDAILDCINLNKDKIHWKDVK